MSFDVPKYTLINLIASFSLTELNEEANSSQSLERVFEDEVKSEVRKRLATDTDYSSEKFPSIHKYFEKEEKP